MLENVRPCHESDIGILLVGFQGFDDAFCKLDVRNERDATVRCNASDEVSVRFLSRARVLRDVDDEVNASAFEILFDVRTPRFGQLMQKDARNIARGQELMRAMGGEERKTEAGESFDR